MIEYNFLKGKIVEMCGTQKKFAELLGISPQELDNKLKSKSNFTVPQLLEAKRILNLDAIEFEKAFFKLK